MTTYVALLRGIGPTNPNMHPKKLKECFELLGFKNVETVIASGNVVFQSASKTSAALEKKIELGLPKHLGFTSTTIVRSKEELLALQKRDPFKGFNDAKQTYHVITFLKDAPKGKQLFPQKGQGYTMIGLADRSLATAIDIKTSGTPDVMRVLEKEYGKAITTRTWKTVLRILKKMGEV